MIVTCPACSTRYNIQPIALGGAGRKVRCSKCGHNWVQPPPASPTGTKPAANPSPAPIVPPSPVMHEVTEWISDPGSVRPVGLDSEPRPTRFPSFGDDRDVVGTAGASEGRDEDPFGYSDPFDEGIGRSRRTRTGRWAKLKGALRWIGFAAAIGGLIGFVVMGRETLVNTWPAAARLYQAIGLPVEAPGAGLQLQSVKSEQRVEDGTVMLVVEGQILNISEIEREVPPLLAMSIGPDHQPVHKWRIPITQAHLAPGAIATFHSVERDPGVVSEVAVTFDGGE